MLHPLPDAYSLTPSLAVASATVTLSVFSYMPAHPRSAIAFTYPQLWTLATPYMLVYMASSATRKILGRIRSPAPSPIITANARLTLYFRFY